MDTGYAACAVTILSLCGAAHAETVPLEANTDNQITAVADENLLKDQNWQLNLSAGVPTPLNVGISRRVNAKTEFAVSGGYFAVGVGSGRRVNTWNIDVGTRWYPWATRFYLGLTARYARLNFDMPITLDSTTGSVADSTLSVGGLYVVPSIGWTWQLSSSMTLGIDFGVQVGVLTGGDISATEDASASDGAAMVNSLSRNSTRAASYFSRFPLPNLTLFRLGWKI
jgi:hypothetical protein